MRKKILTIKSFASKKYGNDITTKGIVELSKRACFKDLDFEIDADRGYTIEDLKEFTKDYKSK